LKAGFESENFWSRADAARRASGRKGCRRQPAEETPGQPTAVVENDAARDGLAMAEHGRLIAHEVSQRDIVASFVIASEAKQSSFLRRGKLDCFVARAPRNDVCRNKKARGVNPALSVKSREGRKLGSDAILVQRLLRAD